MMNQSTQNTEIYPTVLPALHTVIPASIRRRIPRLYRSLRRSLAIDSGTENDDYYHKVRAQSLRCISEPQLGSGYYGESIFTDEEEVIAGNDVAQRPRTAESSSDVEGSLSSVGSSSSNSNLSPANANVLSERGGSEGAVNGNNAGYEGKSGVKWNRVVPGFNLLRSAGYEAQQAQPDSHLIRSLYVNSLVYLLDGLPPDLSPQETYIIQDKLPANVKSAISPPLPPSLPPSSSSSIPALTDGVVSGQAHAANFNPRDPGRSYLHRVLATGIVQFFLLLQFLLPYAKTLLQQVYQYERSHRVAERVVAAAVDAVDSMGKGGVNLGSAILGMNDGRVGMAVADLAGWWVEGIAGGIYEGVGEGMVVMGVMREDRV